MAGTAKTSHFNAIANFLSFDTRSLALARIFFGVILLADFCHKFQYTSAFYSDVGLLPRSDAVDIFVYAPMTLGFANDQHSFSLYFLNGSETFAYLISFFGILAVIAYIVGFKTRIAALYLWFHYLSQVFRFPIHLVPLDYLAPWVVFLSTFLPMGARFSIDAITRRAAQKSEFSSAVVLFWVFICVVCAMAGFEKNAEVWLNGTASFWMMNGWRASHEFSRWIVLSPIGDLLVQLGTHTTVIGERWLWLALFAPFYTGPVRTVTAILIFSLFSAVTILHEGYVIPVFMGSAFLVFLPSWFWDRAVPWFLAYVPKKYRERYSFFRLWWTAKVKSKSGLWITPENPDSVFKLPFMVKSLTNLKNVIVLIWLIIFIHSIVAEVDKTFLSGRKRPSRFALSSIEQKLSNYFRIGYFGLFSVDTRVFPHFHAKFIGTKADGSEISLLNPEYAADDLTPRNVTEAEGGFRMRRFVTDYMWKPDIPRKPALNYFCRTYNAGRKDEDKILEIHTVYVNYRQLEYGEAQTKAGVEHVSESSKESCAELRDEFRAQPGPRRI